MSLASDGALRLSSSEGMGDFSRTASDAEPNMSEKTPAYSGK